MPDILSLLLKLQPLLTKTTCRQLHQIVMAILVMPANITQRSIARWAEKGASYRTVQRFFQTNIDWTQIQWLLFLLVLYVAADTYLLVGDETVLKKSEKTLLDWIGFSPPLPRNQYQQSLFLPLLWSMSKKDKPIPYRFNKWFALKHDLRQTCQ